MKKKNKYRLGTQKVSVPDKGSLDTIANPAISMTSTGASIGGMFGPIGMGVGAGIGALGGLGLGLAEHASMNRMNRIATDKNKYIDKNDLIEDPMISQGQAFKKGTRGIKTYPDGTKGVVTTYTNPSGTTYTGRSVKGSRYKKAEVKPIPHYTPTIYGHNFGQMESKPIYNDGTMDIQNVKPIEVERDELIFKKSGSRYLLKADFKGGKTHAQGGEDYVAQEGDVIFPGKDRKKVMKAYKRNDTVALETMRMGLPKDTNKASNGLDLDPIDQGLVSDPSVDLGYQFNPLVYGNLNTIPENPVATSVPATTESTTNSTTPGMGALSKGLELAPVIYNTVRGLSKPTKTNRRYYNPSKFQYTDISAPARRASQEAFNIDKFNVKSTRGSAGQSQAYLQNASMNKFKRSSDINNFEQGRKLDVYNKNLDQANQAQLTNLQLDNVYDDQDAKNRGRRNDFSASAVSQVSQYTQKQQLNKQLAERDAKMMEMDKQRLNLYGSIYNNYEPAYTFDENGNVVFSGINYKKGPVNRYVQPKTTITKKPKIAKFNKWGN
jgi:hypothetical protein